MRCGCISAATSAFARSKLRRGGQQDVIVESAIGGMAPALTGVPADCPPERP